MLSVGHCCLDYLSDVSSYPSEDQDMRCVSQRWQRGGNASNTSTVLALLGDAPTLACTLANSPEKQFMVSDMDQFGINTDCIVFHDGCHCPSSIVLCSLASGSRTIVHSNQNLPELTPTDFIGLPLDKFSWIHFEGRNVEAVIEMQRLVRQKRGSDVTISVELEKARPDMELLAKHADVVFVSKDFALHSGCLDMVAAAKHFALKMPKRSIIVTWGEDGACGCVGGGAIVSSPAFPPTGGVVDSLGAGDTFIAATIHALRQSNGSLHGALTFGCRVAGLKVGVKGWHALKEQFSKESWIQEAPPTALRPTEKKIFEDL